MNFICEIQTFAQNTYFEKKKKKFSGWEIFHYLLRYAYLLHHYVIIYHDEKRYCNITLEE